MKRTTRRVAVWRCCLLVCGLLVIPQITVAAASANLDLKRAIEQTLARNPDLVSLGFQVQAQQGRVVQSRVGPAPEVGLEVENILGSGIYDGFDGSETTLSLGWILERGKREHYIEAAQAGASALEAQMELARLDAVAMTARLFLDNLEFQEQLEVAREAVAVAEQTVAMVAKRVSSGRSSTADQARAEAELAQALLAAEDLEHELAVVRQRLATQWGQAQPDFERAIGNWQQLPEPESFALLLEQVDRSPEMSMYLSRQRLQEAELRLAQMQAKPDWRLSAGVRHLELTGDHAFVAGISIPLATQARNRGRVAAARAGMAQVDAERMASRLEIEAQLFAIYQALQHSLHRARTLRDEVLPKLQDAAEQTRQGYERGRYGFHELKQLQSELLMARMGLLKATIDAHRQQIEIERLTGAAMPSAVEQP